MKNVLVTGIGGNVGQGILRNIKATQFDIKTIGCNIIDFSSGNHLCDKFYKVPFANKEGYIDEIKYIIDKESIDLVIPSTDFEAYYLSKNVKNLNAIVAVSDENTIFIYLDKYESFLHHKKNNLPFANTYLPSQYNYNFNEYIAKPRLGRGSRGIEINPTDINQFKDDEYIIQEYHRGKEITTAFYVDQKNQLHGFITLERKLENGMTVETKVFKEMDEKIELLLNNIINKTNIRGSANIQSIINNDNEIIPFEINCRISGTNSIRSNFGFEDVKYTLQEYLYNTAPSKTNISSGIATRIYMDVIYPNAKNELNCLDNSAEHYIF
jgi:carbamoyl-phosphate synthase large subunit